MASNFRMLDMLHMLTVGLNGSLLSSTPKLQMCNPYNGAESESVGFFSIAKTPKFHFIGFHAHGDGWWPARRNVRYVLSFAVRKSGSLVLGGESVCICACN